MFDGFFNERVSIEMNPLRWRIIIGGLDEWGGAAYMSDPVAYLFGHRNRAEFYSFSQDFIDDLRRQRDGHPEFYTQTQKVVNYVIASAEILILSRAYGLGPEFYDFVEASPPEILSELRALQGHVDGFLPKSGRVGAGNIIVRRHESTEVSLSSEEVEFSVICLRAWKSKTFKSSKVPCLFGQSDNEQLLRRFASILDKLNSGDGVLDLSDYERIDLVGGVELIYGSSYFGLGASVLDGSRFSDLDGYDVLRGLARVLR